MANFMIRERNNDPKTNACGGGTFADDLRTARVILEQASTFEILRRLAPALPALENDNEGRDAAKDLGRKRPMVAPTDNRVW